VKLSALIATVAVLAVAAPASAQHAGAPPTDGGRSVSLQGGDPRQFLNNPHMHDFYDLSQTTLAKGVGGVDVDAYEQKSFAIFRAFGESTGMGAAAMQDHHKLIPRQVVQIVKEDPHVLDNFETFTDALVGPP